MLRITSIILPNNNMSGEVPQAALASLSAATTINLSGNPGLRLPPGSSCVSLPQCGAAGATCTIGPSVPVCQAPTPAPASGGMDPGLIAVAVVVPIVVLLLCCCIGMCLWVRFQDPDTMPDVLKPYAKGGQGNSNKNNASANARSATNANATAAGGKLTVSANPASASGAGAMVPTIYVAPDERERVRAPNVGESHFSLERSRAATPLENNASLTSAKTQAVQLDANAKKDAASVEELLANLGLEHHWPTFEEDGRFTTMLKLATAKPEDLRELGLNLGERVRLGLAIKSRAQPGSDSFAPSSA